VALGNLIGANNIMSIILSKTPISWIRLLMIIVMGTSLHSVTANAEVALGKESAPVTIIEYASLTCDYCVRFHRKTLPLLKSRHIDTGKVRFVYRDFPTSSQATRGAVAARCAGDQYYEMLDILYTAVDSWSRTADIDAALIQKIDPLGLDVESFRACLNDPQHIRAITKEQQRATRKYGVFGTPTFLINNELVRGIKDIDEIEALIEKALINARKKSTDISVQRSSNADPR